MTTNNRSSSDTHDDSEQTTYRVLSDVWRKTDTNCLAVSSPLTPELNQTDTSKYKCTLQQSRWGGVKCGANNNRIQNPTCFLVYSVISASNSQKPAFFQPKQQAKLKHSALLTFQERHYRTFLKTYVHISECTSPNSYLNPGRFSSTFRDFCNNLLLHPWQAFPIPDKYNVAKTQISNTQKIPLDLAFCKTDVDI